MIARPPIDLWAGIHLEKKLCIHVGEGSRADQVRKKKPDNRLKLHKDLEVLPYINEFNHLFITFLLITEDTHTFSFFLFFFFSLTPFLSGVHLCLVSVLTKQFLCLLSHLLGCVSNNKLCDHLEKGTATH